VEVGHVRPEDATKCFQILSTYIASFKLHSALFKGTLLHLQTEQSLPTF